MKCAVGTMKQFVSVFDDDTLVTGHWSSINNVVTMGSHKHAAQWSAQYQRHVSMVHKQLTIIFTLVSCFLNHAAAQVGFVGNLMTGPCVDDSASMVFWLRQELKEWQFASVCLFSYKL